RGRRARPCVVQRQACAASAHRRGRRSTFARPPGVRACGGLQRAQSSTPRAIADGPSRAPRAQSQRAGIWSCGAAPGKEPADGAITRLGGGELAASVGGELVVAAAGAAFLARRVVFLP